MSRTPDLDEQLDRLENFLPNYLSRILRFLREPRLRWLRTTAGILLIIGGCFWFLPILGLEMIPIGLMLLAIDLPFLRPVVARMIAWGERTVLALMTLWEAVRARLRSDRKRDAPS